MSHGEGRLKTRQWAVVVLVPLLIWAVGLVGHAFFGPVALILPPVLACMFLGYLIVEARGHGERLFTRQVGEVRELYRQLELLQGITGFLKPVYPLPPTRGWAASPDLLREAMSAVLDQRPACVVEASSGTSTIIIGYCLQRVGAGHVFALEHDPVYAARTRKALADHGLTAYATVIDAPLKEHLINGVRHSWYDTSRLLLPGPIGLLLVDGPPDTVQQQARYPAVPLLRPFMAPGALVLLDDGARLDERASAERWLAECEGAELSYLDLEVGAWRLRMPL